MKKIPLGGNKFALVDDDDFEMLLRFRWHIDSRGYAETRISMARMIAKPSDEEVVDHVNQIKLDNRRSNLRSCSQRQNGYNRPMNRKRVKMGLLKGVDFKPGRKKNPW